MNLFIVICITMFLLTFFMLAASGGSAMEGTAASGAANASAQAPANAPAPPEDHLVTTEHSAIVRGQPLD